MRVIIAGGRKFGDYALLKKSCLECLKELKDEGYNVYRSNLEVVSGMARGADQLGERFAKEFSLNVAYFPADWDRYGKKAGFIRNRQMASHAVKDTAMGVLIAFWDGESKGTKSMIELANEYNLRVFIVNTQDGGKYGTRS